MASTVRLPLGNVGSSEIIARGSGVSTYEDTDVQKGSRGGAVRDQGVRKKGDSRSPRRGLVVSGRGLHRGGSRRDVHHRGHGFGARPL